MMGIPRVCPHGGVFTSLLLEVARSTDCSVDCSHISASDLSAVFVIMFDTCIKQSSCNVNTTSLYDTGIICTAECKHVILLFKS